MELVPELSPSDSGGQSDHRYGSLERVKKVWTGKDQARCVYLCRRLKAAGIPFKVDQHHRQYLLHVDEHYRIGVPPECFDDARKVITKRRSRARR